MGRLKICLDYRLFNELDMSSQRSSTSSIPIDILTNPAPSPAAILTSSGTNMWLELNGHSTKLSTPPRLVASKMMSRPRMNFRQLHLRL